MRQARATNLDLVFQPPGTLEGYTKYSEAQEETLCNQYWAHLVDQTLYTPTCSLLPVQPPRVVAELAFGH